MVIKKVRNIKTTALVCQVIIKSFSILARFELERNNVSWEPKSLMKLEVTRS